jgi:hypothetical protein
VLNLVAIASWETAVLASISGARGSPDERDAQITRSGMYAEYPAILGAYVELTTESEHAPTQLEALKRAVFLCWYAYVALPVNTGLAELPESEVRAVMEDLEHTIVSGRADEELRAMLACYRDDFGEVFDFFGPVRSLDAFIRDISSQDARELLGRSTWTGRGQLGMYWSTRIAAPESG